MNDIESQNGGKRSDHKRSDHKRTIKEYHLKPIMTDEEIKKREGTYFDENDIKILVTEDADVYIPDSANPGKEKILLKFRKNVFPENLTKLAWDAFHKTAAASRNRGAAAGPIDLKSMYWKKRKPVEIDKWGARYMQDGKVSKMRVNNNVYSSVLGYFEETPFMKLPCRLTTYTQTYFNYYKMGLPFIEAIDGQFKKLMPERHKKQFDRAKKKSFYQINDTAFSSLTINRNFRTALHQDAGDYREGYGNLSVVERGKYHGGNTIFPQYGVAIDLRTGDFVAMDVHEWHCNTKMYETKEDKEFNKKLENVFRHDPTTGTMGSTDKYSRLSFVCYLREKMIDCDEKETRAYYKKIHLDPVKGFTNKTKKAKKDDNKDDTNKNVKKQTRKK
jgi:hypothetical protein